MAVAGNGSGIMGGRPKLVCSEDQQMSAVERSAIGSSTPPGDSFLRLLLFFLGGGGGIFGVGFGLAVSCNWRFFCLRGKDGGQKALNPNHLNQCTVVS